MEHHLLPRKPTQPSFKVPYVCLSQYDCGSFPEYPNRAGRSWMIPPGGEELTSSTLSFSKHLYPESTTQQESFFQTWLFFGLLSTVLGPLYAEKDFLDGENDPKFISTVKLASKIEEARRTWSASGSADQGGQISRMAECISIIWAVIGIANFDFDWRVKLSIVSVASTLAEVIHLEYQGTSIEKGPRFWKHDFPDAISRSDMLSNGWCPSELAGNIAKFNSLQTLFFLSRVDRSYLQRSHVQCTDRLCTSYQIDANVYKTKHTESHSPCPSIEVDANKVYEILLTGALPLIRVNNDGDLTTVEIVASGAETHYIAISHVWADGLGNPNENSLPSCQLRRIKQLATDLFAKLLTVNENGKDTDYDLFWIDTLCCPAQSGKAKDLSIIRIRETYANASAVLVLDSGLQQIIYDDINPIEAALSISTCGWTQRLWTLQEGALPAPRNLWVQFEDGPRNLDAIYTGSAQNLTENRGQSITNASIFRIREDLKIQFGAGVRMETPLDNKKHSGFDFIMLDRGLIHRSVSVASDEPLCIATLLKLDLQEVVNVKAKDEKIDDLGQLRMCKIWQLVANKLNGIPEGVLGLNYPRLNVKGFKWAPRTLLKTNIKSNREARWLGPLAQLTELGLQVRYESILFNLSPSEDASFPDFSSDLEDADASGPIPLITGELRCWMLLGNFIIHGRASPTFDPPLLRDLFNKPLAILKLPNAISPNAWQSEALLGSVNQLATDGRIFSQMMPIYLYQTFPHLDTIYDGAEKVISQRRVYRRYIETFKCSQAVESDLEGKTIHLVRLALNDPELRRAMQLVFNIEGDDAVQRLLWFSKLWFSYDVKMEKLGAEQVWYVD